jgi:hypothetical protein
VRGGLYGVLHEPYCLKSRMARHGAPRPPPPFPVRGDTHTSPPVIRSKSGRRPECPLICASVGWLCCTEGRYGEERGVLDEHQATKLLEEVLVEAGIDPQSPEGCILAIL